MGTNVPAVTVTDAVIRTVPATDPPGPGPLTAAYFDGSSSLLFGTGQALYQMEYSGTISVLFQSTAAGQAASIVGYEGRLVILLLHFKYLLFNVNLPLVSAGFLFLKTNNL